MNNVKQIQIKIMKKLFQLQASCLSAFVLNPPRGSLIIDGCAAPGNKSTHLACMIYNEG